MAAERREVVWTESARDDLNRIIEGIAEESPQSALKTLDRLLEAAASLAELGDRGRQIPELGRPSIRELLPPRYRLVYRTSAQQIEILGVLHQRQDFERWGRAFQASE